MGRPHRLRLPRLRGRRRGRHRRRRPTFPPRCATSSASGARPSSTPSSPSMLDDHRGTGHDRHGGRRGRRARRLPIVQLRAHLPPARERAPGRPRHRAAPGADRVVRRPPRGADRRARCARRPGRRRRPPRQRHDRPLRPPDGRATTSAGTPPNSPAPSDPTPPGFPAEPALRRQLLPESGQGFTGTSQVGSVHCRCVPPHVRRQGTPAPFGPDDPHHARTCPRCRSRRRHHGRLRRTRRGTVQDPCPAGIGGHRHPRHPGRRTDLDDRTADGAATTTSSTVPDAPGRGGGFFGGGRTQRRPEPSRHRRAAWPRTRT